MPAIRLIVEWKDRLGDDPAPVQDVIQQALEDTGSFREPSVAIEPLEAHIDPWVSDLSPYFDDIANGRIASVEVWRLIEGPYDARLASDKSRMTAAMRNLGWERAIKRLGGVPRRCFIRGTGWPEWFVDKDPVTGRLAVRGVDPSLVPPVFPAIPIRRDEGSKRKAGLPPGFTPEAVG